MWAESDSTFTCHTRRERTVPLHETQCSASERLNISSHGWTVGRLAVCAVPGCFPGLALGVQLLTCYIHSVNINENDSVTTSLVFQSASTSALEAPKPRFAASRGATLSDRPPWPDDLQCREAFPRPPRPSRNDVTSSLVGNGLGG